MFKHTLRTTSLIVLGLLGFVALFLLASQFGLKQIVQQYIAYYELNHPLRNNRNLFDQQDHNKINNTIAGQQIVIPFHYTKSGNILIPVGIAGHRQQFILDTGSTYSSLWEEIAPKISKVTNTKIAAVILGNEITNDSFCKVPEIRLDKLSFRDIPMKTIPAFGDFDTKATAGFLGNNILKNFTVTVDYKAKQIVLSSLNCPPIPSSNATVVPFKEHYGCPYIEVSLDETPNRPLLVDTGTPFNYAPISILKSFLKEPILVSGKMTGVWIKQAYDWSRLKSLKLDSIYYNPIFCVGSSIECQKATVLMSTPCDVAFLGNDFLSQFKTTFDYHNKRIIFEPYAVQKITALHHLIEGTYSVAHKDFGQAINEFNQVLMLEPDFAGSAYAGCGEADIGLKDYQKALRDYSSAIALDAQDFGCYINRGYTYLQLDKYQQAIDDCTIAIKLNPKAAEAYFNRACAYGWLGQDKKAIEDCTNTINLDSKDALAYQSRELGYGKLGQYKKTIEDCDKAISLDGKFQDAYATRGVAYLNLAKYDRSMEDFNIAIRLNSQDASSYYNRGCVFKKISNYKKAMDDFNKAISLDSKFAAVYHERADCYRKIGYRLSALKDESKALKLGYKKTKSN